MELPDFFQVPVPVCIPTSKPWKLPFLYISPASSTVSFWILVILMCIVVPQWGHLPLPLDKWNWISTHALSIIFVSSLVKCLLRPSAYFSIGMFVVCCWILSIHSTFLVQVLFRCVLTVFSQSMPYLFILSRGSFREQRFLTLIPFK